MTETFYIKQKDGFPDIEAFLLDGADNPVDLTGAISSTLHIMLGGVLKYQLAVSIADAKAGFVRFNWGGHQAIFTQVVGEYDAEIQIVFLSGATSQAQTFPSDGYFKIKVEESIS